MSRSGCAGRGSISTSHLRGMRGTGVHGIRDGNVRWCGSRVCIAHFGGVGCVDHVGWLGSRGGSIAIDCRGGLFRVGDGWDDGTVAREDVICHCDEKKCEDCL